MSDESKEIDLPLNTNRVINDARVLEVSVEEQKISNENNLSTASEVRDKGVPSNSLY